MVKKDYFRFEQDSSFGVITSNSNVIWLPPTATSSTGGRAFVGALENATIWDIKTGDLLSQISEETSAAASTVSEVTCVAEFNGQLLATGYSSGVIKIWDSITGTLQVSFNAHRKGVTVLKFDSTGTRLVSGSKDTNIIMWDLVNEVGLYRLRSHRDQVVGLEFIRGRSKILSESENGEEREVEADADEEAWLLSTSKDGTLKLWDLETQHCVETHMAHSSNDSWSLGYSPSMRVAVTGSGNKELAFWKLDLSPSAEMGKRVLKQGSLNKQSGDRAHTIKFFNDNSLAATLSETVDENGQTIVEEPRYMAVASADRNIEVFRIKTADEIKKSVARKIKRRREKGLDVDSATSEFKLDEESVDEKYISFTVIRTPSKVRSFDFAFEEVPLQRFEMFSSRDVRPPANSLFIVASLANNAIETYSIQAPMSKHATVKKSAGPAEYTRVYSIDRAGHRADVRALSLSSDDKMVASASNGQLKVWNVKTQQCIRTFDCGYALCCSFLPGDGLIVVGTKSGDLELYDVASSTLLETVAAHPNGGSVWSLNVGSDGKTFVTAGGAEKTVKFWEIKIVQEQVPGTLRKVPKMRFKNTKTLELPDDVMSVRLSPDMRLVACALLNSTVKVFFADSLKFSLDLYGHKLPVLGMDISKDSKLLVTCSADKNIKIWGLDFGDCHKSIFAHQESIMNVAFDPLTDAEGGDLNGYDDFGGDDDDETNGKERAAHNFFSVAKDKLVKYWDGDNFQQVQRFVGHHSEIWALAVARSGEFVVTGSHDKSIRVWKRTGEQVFLEEEKERELEEQYESTLTAAYDADAEDDMKGKKPAGPDDLDDEARVVEDDENETQVTRAGKQTIETLKAGERLIEALEIGIKDLKLHQEHADMVKRLPKGQVIPALGARDVRLQYLNISAQDYVMKEASTIKASELEDALLVLPFDKVLALFEFIAEWLKPRNEPGSQSDTPLDKGGVGANKTTLICRMLFTLIRLYHKPLVANQVMRPTLESVQRDLKTRLNTQRDRIGYNIAGLKTVKETWDRDHRKEFVDETLQNEEDERLAKKRVFTKV